MTGFLESILPIVAAYKYPLIFFATILQGPTIMTGSGFLLRLGTFSFWPLYIALVLGDLMGDIVWYSVGRRWAEPFLRRFGYIFGITPKIFAKVEGMFERHDTKILFISKITMGFGFALATLMAAGAMRVPFRKYLMLNLVGGFIWTALLLSLGYFLGSAYTLVDQGLRIAFLAASAVIIVGAFIGFASFLRRKYS